MSGSRPDLSVSLGPLHLEHPIVNASGTFDLYEVAEATACPDMLAQPPVAAYVPKTVTLEPRRGNPPPRLIETAAGLLNSIGLANMGVEAFAEQELPRLLALPCPVIVSIGGFSVEEYRIVASRLRRALEERALLGWEHESPWWLERVGLELNVSCPNVQSAGMTIGADADETAAVVSSVRSVWPGLLIVKLTPNVGAISPIAEAAQAAGASAISLVNGFRGLAVDRVTLKPYLGGRTGGLSGPAIKPLALRLVYEVFDAVSLPLIGMGGVVSVQDVVDFLACGATVVAVGIGLFRDPWLARRLSEGLSLELGKRGLNLREVIGAAHR